MRIKLTKIVVVNVIASGIPGIIAGTIHEVPTELEFLPVDILILRTAHLRRGQNSLPDGIAEEEGVAVGKVGKVAKVWIAANVTTVFQQSWWIMVFGG